MNIYSKLVQKNTPKLIHPSLASFSIQILNDNLCKKTSNSTMPRRRSMWSQEELHQIDMYNQELMILSDKQEISRRIKELTDSCRKPVASSTVEHNQTPNTVKSSVRTIDDLSPEQLKDKVVFLRVDFNVKYQKAGEDLESSLVPGVKTNLEVNPSSMKRIVESLPTIKRLISAGAKIVLSSHLGDPTEETKDDPKFSLGPAAVALATLLKDDFTSRVYFSSQSTGEEAAKLCRGLNPGDILVIENTRLYPGKAEKKNDIRYAELLKETFQPDVYINDAFGTAHRAHVSVSALPSILSGPKVAGILLSTEVKYLSEVLPPKQEHVANGDRSKAVVILGGAKVSSKVPVMKNLITRADTFLIGGAMALPFLKAQGFNAGIMKDDGDSVELSREILDEAKASSVKVVLPVDFVTATSFAEDSKTIIKDAENLDDMDYSIDIGPKTTELFANIINDKSTRVAVWNGPVGVFEWKIACQGTDGVVKSLDEATKSGVITVVGGGETAQAVVEAKKRGIDNTMTHVSTGGGASLEMLEGKVLPALQVLDKK